MVRNQRSWPGLQPQTWLDDDLLGIDQRQHANALPDTGVEPA